MRRGSVEGITNFIGGLNTSVGPLNNPGNLLEAAYNVEIGLDGSLSSRIPFTEGYPFVDVYIEGKADTIFSNNAFQNIDYLSDLVVGEGNNIISIDTHYWESKDIYAVTFYGESDNMLSGSSEPDKYLAIAFISSYEGALVFESSGVALYFGGPFGSWNGVIEFGEDHIYVPWGEWTASSFGSAHYYYINYNDLSDIGKNTHTYYRDFSGIPNFRSGSTSTNNTVKTDERLGVISTHQYYNMVNAGWPEKASAVENESGSSSYDSFQVLIGTREQMGTFPALGDSYEKAKIQETSNYESLGAYSAWQNHRQKLVKDAYVPKGNTILRLGTESVYRRLALDILGDYTLAGPVTIVSGYSFFSDYENESEKTEPALGALSEIDGRMWYSFSGRDFNLAFSQIRNTSDDQWREKCYQDANPTDPISNSIVATDGGTISVTNMGEVIKFKKYNNYILAFCKNGVWAITGGEPGTSFSPSSFSIFKVSNATVISPKMITDTSIGLAFMSYEGLQFLSVTNDGVSIINKSENRVDDRVSRLYDMTNICSMSFDRKSGRLFSNLKRGSHFTTETYTLVYDTKIDTFYEWNLHALPYGSFQSNPIEDSYGKSTFGVLSFNDQGIFSFCIKPEIGYQGSNNNHVASTLPSVSKHLAPGFYSGASPVGCYGYKQTDQTLESFESADIDLYDFGVTKDSENYQYFRGPYPCLARISYSGQEFNVNKIVEHLSVMYRNGPYANDPTDSDFIAPALYIRPRWDWQYSDSVEDIEVVGYHTYPYQTTYDSRDFMMYRGKIPGKGNLLSLDIFTPVDRSNSGFKILGYAALVTKAGRP